MKKPVSLYLHIPFCRDKCVYCDFHSFPCHQGTMGEYMEGLKKEILLYEPILREYHIPTIFFGGGTPSLLGITEVKEILDSLQEHFFIDGDAEISLEGNPESLTPEKLKGYKYAGVNRLSIGMQSHLPTLLKALGRLHTKEDFLRACHSAETAGFENISVDVMFGLPDQTMEDFKGTLEFINSLDIQHISAYGLIVSEETPLYDKIQRGEISKPDEDLEGDMYEMLVNDMTDRGWDHYEISNFAKDGHQCRHNRVYWENQEYIGLGLGAHSSFNDERFSNHEEMNAYLSSVKQGEIPVAERERIATEERLRESLILGLRMMEGIQMKDIENRHQASLSPEMIRELQRNVRKGLLEEFPGGYRLTKQGLYLSNSVFRDLIG